MSIATLCLQTQVVLSLEIISPSRYPSSSLVFLATHLEKVVYICCLHFIATFPPPVTSMSPSSPWIYPSFPCFPPPSFECLVTTFTFLLKFPLFPKQSPVFSTFSFLCLILLFLHPIMFCLSLILTLTVAVIIIIISSFLCSWSVHPQGLLFSDLFSAECLSCISSCQIYFYILLDFFFSSTLNWTDIKVNSFYFPQTNSFSWLWNFDLWQHHSFSDWGQKRSETQLCFLLLLTLPCHFTNKWPLFKIHNPFIFISGCCLACLLSLPIASPSSLNVCTASWVIFDIPIASWYNFYIHSNFLHIT